MSVFMGIFNTRFHNSRYTEILYKGEATEKIIQIDPNEESRIEINFDSAQTGDVFLNGTFVLGSGTCDAGETVSFSAIKGNQSSNYFTLLNGVCPSDGITGIMTIRAINGDGDPVKNLFHEDSFFGFKIQMDEKFKFETFGYQKEGSNVLYCDHGVDIELGDRIHIENLVDAKEYEVIENTMIQVDGLDDHRRLILR